MRLFAISGSLRHDSYNSALLRAASTLLPAGVDLAIYDALEQIPPFNEDRLHPVPAPITHLREAVAAAEGVLIATPEYNSSIPGVLKNALDWLSRPLLESPLRNLPAVVIGASTGMFGAVWAQADTRKVLGAIGARVLDLELPVPTAHEQFDAVGRLRDEDLERELVAAVEALVQAVDDRAEAIAATDAK